MSIIIQVFESMDGPDCFGRSVSLTEGISDTEDTYDILCALADGVAGRLESRGIPCAVLGKGNPSTAKRKRDLKRAIVQFEPVDKLNGRVCRCIHFTIGPPGSLMRCFAYESDKEEATKVGDLLYEFCSPPGQTFKETILVKSADLAIRPPDLGETVVIKHRVRNPDVPTHSVDPIHCRTYPTRHTEPEHEHYEISKILDTFWPTGEGVVFQIAGEDDRRAMRALVAENRLLKTGRIGDITQGFLKALTLAQEQSRVA